MPCEPKLAVEELMSLLDEDGEQAEHHIAGVKHWISTCVADSDGGGPTPKRRKKTNADGTPKKKRPPNAYNQFQSKCQADLKKTNPNMPQKEKMKECARQYNQQKCGKDKCK